MQGWAASARFALPRLCVPLCLLMWRQHVPSTPDVLEARTLCRYRDAPEPQLAGQSVTVRPGPELRQQLHEESARTFNAPLARLMQVYWLNTLFVRH